MNSHALVVIESDSDDEIISSSETPDEAKGDGAPAEVDADAHVGLGCQDHFDANFHAVARYFTRALAQALERDPDALTADILTGVLERGVERRVVIETSAALEAAGKPRMNTSEFWYFVGTLQLVACFSSWITAYATFPDMRALEFTPPMAKRRVQDILRHVPTTSVSAAHAQSTMLRRHPGGQRN